MRAGEGRRGGGMIGEGIIAKNSEEEYGGLISVF